MIQKHHTKSGKRGRIFYSGLFLFLLFIFISCATNSSLNYSNDSSLTYVKNGKTEYILKEISLDSVTGIFVGNSQNLLAGQTIDYIKKEISDWKTPESPLEFVKKTNSNIAFNTVPFFKKRKFFSSGKKAKGILLYNNTLFAEPDERYGTFAFFKGENGLFAEIYDCQTDVPLENALCAVGGFWTILNGETIYQFKDIKEYRTAIGISYNKKIIYVLSGKNLSYMDCAEIFKQKGAYKAFEFDGGHSTFFYSEQNGNKTRFSHPHVRKSPVYMGIKEEKY